MLSKPKKGQALPAGRKVEMKENLKVADGKLPYDGGMSERKCANELADYVNKKAVKR